MRFFANGPDIPLSLLEARDRGEVVFLCGAGISVPAGLPSFIDLAKNVATELGAQDKPLVRHLFAPPSDPIPSIPMDQLFGYFQQEYGNLEVERIVSRRLRTPRNANLSAHKTILRLSSDARGNPRLITTNFDLLFEAANKKLKSYVPPYLPDLDFAGSLHGLVYLHGRLDGSLRREDTLQGLVLGISDMGRAYLADGWATRFLNQVLARYTIVLIGYSADDVPIKYLLEGLRARGRSPVLFAFAEGEPGETETRWWGRGVKAIPYTAADREHSVLWNSLSAWANRAHSLDEWHARTLELAGKGPRALEPHERGQVAAMAQTVRGAEAIANSSTPIPAEWLCVFDPTIRHGRVAEASWSGDEERFDPLETYGLDEDPPRQDTNPKAKQAVGLNVLTALNAAERGPNHLRLAGQMVQRSEPLGPRLNHLARWIGRVSQDPTCIWWAVHHHQIHTTLQDVITWHLRQTKDSAPIVRKAWRLYFGSADARPNRANSDWYDMLDVLKHDGWTSSTKRIVKEALTPFLQAQPPSWRESRPPKPGDEPKLSKLVKLEIKYVGKGKSFPIPADNLAFVVAALREGLLYAANLKDEIEELPYPRTPTLHHEDKPGTVFLDDEDAYFLWFAERFKDLVAKDPSAAAREFTQWPRDEPWFFSKLCQWALIYPTVATPQQVTDTLAAVPSREFWNSHNQRELLWSLRARWPDLADAQRRDIENRILAGREPWANEEPEDFQKRNASAVATRLGWMLHHGMQLGEEASEALPRLRAVDSNWQASWDAQADHSYDSRGGWVRTESDPSDILNIPLAEIVPRIETTERRPSGMFVERDPFAGLFAQRPARALAVLTFESKHGRYPIKLWHTLIAPDKSPTSERFNWVLAKRLARLPHDVILQISHSASGWIEAHIAHFYQRHPQEALEVWDALFSGVVSAGASGTVSGIGDTSIGGVSQNLSRRTYSHAINSPVGKLTSALAKALDTHKFKKSEGLPADFKARITSLLGAPGEGSDHAASEIGIRLPWIYFIDPGWTTDTLLPLFDLGHPLAEAAWNGLLHRNNFPQRELFMLLKPNFLKAFSVSSEWRWDDGAASRLPQFAVLGSLGSAERKPEISKSEARTALEALNDTGRTAALWQLHGMIQKSEDWRTLGMPFLANIWPRAIRYQTPAAAHIWANIATNSDDAFPEVVQSVRNLLQPIDELDSAIFDLTHKEDGKRCLAERFPAEAVLLIDKLTSESRAYMPYNMREFLRLCAEQNPELSQNLSWRRLSDLISTT